jgi:hypothetical protein
MTFLCYISVIALTVCLSTSARANFNPCVNMNQEAEEVVFHYSKQVNLTRNVRERFWKKVQKDGPIPDQTVAQYLGLGKCWEWTGSLRGGGYGQFSFDHKTPKPAHVISWLIHYGSIADIRQNVLHKCDRRSCVNPAHLWLGTDYENAKDREAKRRGLRALGDKNGSVTKSHRLARGPRGARCKLDEKKIREIRRLFSEGIYTQSELAVQYQVHDATISDVVSGKSWKRVV